MTAAQLTVDLDALAANFHALARIGGVAVHPVVKADAYGLGAIAVCRRLRAEGADTVFVARVEAGVVLRRALGPDLTIYVLDGCTSDDAATIKGAHLRPVLNHGAQLVAWRQAGGGPCALHLDTGMNRLGFRPEEAPAPFEGLGLVMSHLACADDPGHPMNAAQRDAFAAASQRYPGVVRSLANSGGCFLGPGFGFDASRPGISLYGGGPQGRPHPGLKPVATFTAPVVQLRQVPAGESIGYGRGHVAEQPLTVAVCGAGYANGVLRSTSPQGRVFVSGTLRPILGRVSMDLLAVDVTGLDVAEGDLVELFGANHPVDDAATDAGTIAYELLTAVGAVAPRRYLGASGPDA